MSVSIGSRGPAKLILMMRAPWLAAQSTPLRILNVVPCALSCSPAKARTASSFTFGATPIELGMRGDGAGHAGAVRVRRRGGAERVELADEHAGEIGMLRVDFGIDHSHDHVVAIGELVRFQKMQLGNDVLLGVWGWLVVLRRRRLRLRVVKK